MRSVERVNLSLSDQSGGRSTTVATPSVGVEAQAAEIRRLSRPFWATVLIGAVSLLVFVAFLTRSLDRNSIEQSQQVFKALLIDRMGRLETLVLEYGYWDSAVENLVKDLNLQWVDQTFVDYLQENLQVEALHVLDGDNRPKLQILNDTIAEFDLSQYESGLTPLLKKARRGNAFTAPEPVSGLIGNLTDLSMASAIVLTTYDDVDIRTDHLLVFVQPLDSNELAALSEKYGLPNLRLSSSMPTYWQGGFELSTVDGTELGYLIWDPALPGIRLLPLMAIGVLLVFICTLLTARLYVHRATAIVRDLAEAKHEAEHSRELLAEQAQRDFLTKLGNRRFLDEKMSELEAQEVSGDGYALLYLDLDGFKQINDEHGHEMGDLVLQHVAKSLRAFAGDDDAVVRIGGDEFVIVFSRADKERINNLGRMIIEHLSEPMQLNDVVCKFGASIGIAFATQPSELLRQADVALYAAKRRGRGQMAVYTDELLELKGG